MANPRQSEPGSSDHLLSILAAWCVPGLGHLLVGDRRRGLILMAALLGLYLMGLVIGGIDVVDRKEDRLWYAAQLMAGPITVAVDMVHQELKNNYLVEQRKNPYGGPPAYELASYTVSVGRVNELGTLYCALAGMLNLLVIIDLAWAGPRRVSPDKPEPVLRGRVITREESA